MATPRRAEPRERRDLVVIGGGPAGIVATATAASLGARTLLVEKSGRLGGECSWTGCVPSKTLLHLASRVHLLREAGAEAAARDLAAGALAATRRRVAEIAADAGTRAMLEGMGAEVVVADPRLVAAGRVELDGRTVEARRVIVATGSSPRPPDLAGLEAVPHRTNVELFDLESPPRRLLVLGGGPVGVEMAQAFARLGSSVRVVTRAPRILPRDDGELVADLAAALADEGIEIVTGAEVEAARPVEDGLELRWHAAGSSAAARADLLLVATGRQANVGGLGLERLGVRAGPEGLTVDDRLFAARPWLLAAGDVTGRGQFSHVAEHEAIAAVRNAFFPFPQRVDPEGLPWCTFTDPELAHLGPTEEELRRRGTRFQVHAFPFEREDRARTEGVRRGRVKLLATPGGRLLGAHILGPRAGEVMNELVLAKRQGASLADLALTVHIYPTLSLAIQRAADLWIAQRGSSPWLQRLARLFTRRT